MIFEKVFPYEMSKNEWYVIYTKGGISMKEFKECHNDILGAKTVAALIKNNFTATYVKTREEAVRQITDLIPVEATVGVGGSWTIQEIGLDATLKARGNTMFNHNSPGLSPAEASDFRHKQLACDVFITSTNALTLEGELVNVDGVGNRVAAMMFGPKKVIIIAGVNKIIRDISEAQNRIELYAAPINNTRLNRPNPCVKTGECMDCQGPTRICNITTILHKRPGTTDIHIFIVGEELGF
jgi:L-lactate utilization protein LutB